VGPNSPLFLHGGIVVHTYFSFLQVDCRPSGRLFRCTMGLIRPNRGTSFHSVMLLLFTDLPDPMAALRRPDQRVHGMHW
jgi:hypothetical protein